MAKTVLTPTFGDSVQVVRWDLTTVGADEAHTIGHNVNRYHIYLVATQGEANLKIEGSPDGTTYYDLTNTITVGTTPQLVTLNVSAKTVRPRITQINSSPCTIIVYLVGLEI